MAGEKNIESKNFDVIRWGEGAALDGLSQLRERTDRQALDAIAWYYNKKKSKNFWSRWLRFWAITFTVLGGLVPVLTAAGAVQFWLQHYGYNDVNIQMVELRFNQFGYVFIGLAAGCIAFDRFFGFSTNWMRYIGAAMRIETARVRFAFEWEHVVAPLRGRDLGEDEIRQLLQAIQRLSLDIREAIEQETGAWITEFQTNLAQLDKETKALFESARNEKKALERRTQARTRDARPRGQM
jgi:hypothetical protein